MSLSLCTPNPQPTPRPLHLEAAWATHAGWRRKTNEDELAVHPELGLFLVADGLDGHAGGRLAARMAVDAATAAIVAGGPPSSRPTRASAGALLVSAIERANASIFAAAQRDPALHGMGTTMVAALAHGGRLAVAHAGDSRAYLLRGRRLELLTEDHSFLNQCRYAGIDPFARPDLQQYWHALARAVGPRETVELDTRLVPLQPGDILLLCSDGLTCVVDDREIAAILVGCADLGDAADRLVARANEHGSPDNVTAVLARWVL